jgi:Family of unknown function (DUF695)
MLRRTVRDAAAAPVWEISDPWGVGPSAGSDCWRFNAAMRFARDTRLYPYCLEVVVSFAKTGPVGHPTAETARLADLEEEVTAVVADRAVLVGVLTTLDDLRFVFYADSAEWTAKLRSQLRGATGIGTLRVNCDPDLKWFEYRTFRKRRDYVGPETLRLFGLCVAAAILCLMVQAAYHGAWGAGEAVVGIVLVASRWMRRNGLLRFPAHPAVTFGASALALAAIVFPLLGLARVPAWAGLIISVLAGPALAPLVRKARNRRWRPLRRTLRDPAGKVGFQSD